MKIRRTKPAAPKQYDRAYFDRWYRSRRRVVTPDTTRRNAALALAAAEVLLERPIRSVLDIGCGEGQWRAVLRRTRPGVRYTGVDPSDYVVGRFGRRRNIRQGGFGDLAELGLRGTFDLIVCSNVIHYVSTPDLRRGLPVIAEHLGGVAWLEVHTAHDPVTGDVEEMCLRTENQYRRLFETAGLTAVGMHCWVKQDWVKDRWLRRMELP